jgi:hypothetical protein
MEGSLEETLAVSKLDATRAREWMHRVISLLDAAVGQLHDQEHAAQGTLLEAASLLSQSRSSSRICARWFSAAKRTSRDPSGARSGSHRTLSSCDVARWLDCARPGDKPGDSRRVFPPMSHRRRRIRHVMEPTI